jgi:hypothetical protein
MINVGISIVLCNYILPKDNYLCYLLILIIYNYLCRLLILILSCCFKYLAVALLF